MNYPIDFVIMWVDGNDPDWRREKNLYDTEIDGDKRNIRYRDWSNLQYWFRSVEKFAPWVNKIHFVTWGHYPSWLNVNHPKVNLVSHTDFISKEFLPTFNSRAIEVNLHRIEGLSEHFVYFNDDMFITKPVKRSDFFKNGLPRDVAIPYPCSSTSRLGIGSVISNNMEIINTTFRKRDTIKANLLKWYSPLYKKFLIGSISMIPYSYFTSFLSTHIPHSYLKNTFKEIWNREGQILEATSRSKFRDKNNVNQWLMRYWQLAAGDFYPRNINDGKLFMLGEKNDLVIDCIKKQEYKLICLNDGVEIKDFELQKEKIISAFNYILPDKSEYEI